METHLKGKKMCDKHLLNSRFTDAHPPEMHKATYSLSPPGSGPQFTPP